MANHNCKLVLRIIVNVSTPVKFKDVLTDTLISSDLLQ